MAEQTSRLACAMTLLMLTSAILTVLGGEAGKYNDAKSESQIVLEGVPSSHIGSAKGATSQFADGNTSLSLNPSAGEVGGITNRVGQRINGTSLNLTAGGLREWSNDTHSMISLAANSTMSMTTVDASGDLRLNTTYGGNVPNAGTNNTQVHLNSMWAAGNYSFDTFRIICIGLSCGSITVQGGPLRIYANTIIIDQGAGIYADEMVWGNTGQGGSTMRGSNGKSPGAGGAGHGASGGIGGGTNGGAGGVNYGNGSEPGSSGGNVTFTNSNGQTSVDAQGGKGGGVIELVARTIWMNGTISANGGRGDDGAPPASGTGPGGSGAGGGSGGSIVLMANTVNIGNTGTLRAVGNDGGDGADGVQNGPGIGMYDGGHGGGGGAGGIVMAVSTPNNLNNNGVMHANGGSGGSGGRAYGTGSAGSAGNNGGNGYAFTGTFAGWGGAPIYAYSGNYTSPIFGQSGVVNVDSTSVVDYTSPANTSVNGSYHYSLDGVTWSNWLPLNLSNQSLPPFAFIQFHFDLATSDNSTTPRVGAINLSASSWYSLDGLTLSIANSSSSPNTFWASGNDFGVVRNVTAIAGMGPTTIRSFVPTNATPLASAWFHIIPPTFNQASDVEISVGGTSLLSLNSSDFPSMGITVEVPLATLLNSWPSTPFTNNGSGGLAWSNLEVTCSATGPFMGSFSSSFAIIPYEVGHRIGVNGTIVSAINDYVNQTSGRWAEASFSTFPLTADATAHPNHTVVLDALSVTYIDDILPEVTNISFWVDGQPVTEARVGDMVEVRVKVLGNESDATVEWHMEGLGGISSWPPPTLSAMAWDTLHNGYIAFFDTSQFSSEYGDSIALWLWLRDVAGNERDPNGVGSWYDVLVLKPVYPDFDSIQVGGCERVVVSICEAEAGAELVFQVAAVEGRSDLDVFAHLTSSSGESETILQLFWHDSSKVYDGSFIFTPDRGEWWDLVFRVMDVNRNEDNWSTAAVTMVKLIDETRPIEGALVVGENPTSSQSWSIHGEWWQRAKDGGNATLSVSGPDNYSSMEVFSPHLSSDRMKVQSYVALGGPEVMGVGASKANNSTTGLVHSHLDSIWPDVGLANISDPWGSVQNFISARDEVVAANPELVTILPLRDYISSSTSVWQSNYPTLLDDLGALGAQVYLGQLQLDPDYTCHIASGSAGCHSYGEYEMVREKNRIITEIVSTRPWVTLVPLSDDGPVHPEWYYGNGDLTDAGHSVMAESFIRAIDGVVGQRLLNMSGSHLLDISSLAPGHYNFEMVVEDEQGNRALDAQSGPDATAFLAPQSDILSLTVTAPMGSTPIYPGEVHLTAQALCALDCDMLLDIYLDGVFIEQLTPTGGEILFTVDIRDVGEHSVSLRLSTPEWEVWDVNASTDISVTPHPAPEWSINCLSYDEETVLDDHAMNGEIGSLRISTHYIDCTVSNSGNADAEVIVSPASILTPFECTSDAVMVVQGGSGTIHCTAEESEENAGMYTISLGIDEVREVENKSIGGIQSEAILLSPRFQTDEIADGGEPGTEKGDGVEVAGKSPLKWILSAFLLLIIGLGGITLLFSMRDGENRLFRGKDDDSPFALSSSSGGLSELEAVHPALVAAPLEIPPSSAEPPIPTPSHDVSGVHTTTSVPQSLSEMTTDQHLDKSGGPVSTTVQAGDAHSPTREGGTETDAVRGLGEQASASGEAEDWGLEW